LCTMMWWGNFISGSERLQVASAKALPASGLTRWRPTHFIAFSSVLNPTCFRLQIQYQDQNRPGLENSLLGPFYIPSHSGIMALGAGHSGSNPVSVSYQREQTTATPFGDSLVKMGIKNRVNIRAGEEVRSNNQ